MFVCKAKSLSKSEAPRIVPYLWVNPEPTRMKHGASLLGELLALHTNIRQG